MRSAFTGSIDFDSDETYATRRILSDNVERIEEDCRHHERRQHQGDDRVIPSYNAEPATYATLSEWRRLVVDYSDSSLAARAAFSQIWNLECKIKRHK